VRPARHSNSIVAIEYTSLRQDKVVATLMVLAAESVKSGKRSHDYWQVERRWIAGETQAIMREAHDRVRAALPTESARRG